MRPNAHLMAAALALGMGQSIGGAEVIKGPRHRDAPPLPRERDRIRSPLAKYFASYAKRYASIASSKKSKFKGFRKVRRSWQIQTPTGWRTTSAWVRR